MLSCGAWPALPSDTSLSQSVQGQSAHPGLGGWRVLIYDAFSGCFCFFSSMQQGQPCSLDVCPSAMASTPPTGRPGMVCVHVGCATGLGGRGPERAKEGHLSLILTCDLPSPVWLSFLKVNVLVWVITCHFDTVLPSKTMHFRQVERMVSLVHGLRGSGHSPATSHLQL